MGTERLDQQADFESLVEQYDGDASVADNEPTGSVFAVTLPRAA